MQAIVGLQRYGKTLTAHLDSLGALGPHFTVAHGVWLDHDDMKRLGDHGASVAHNPGSNMRLGSGLADTRAMLDRGVNLGIGTDGASCSDNQNVYEAMRLASFVSKAQGPEWQRWLTAREAALAATGGSARALGFGDRIGRIAPGWKADLVLLDLDHPNWLPLNNPVNQLVAKGMLAKLGCQVLVAGHGGEALDLLEREAVDLVLMDCNMPVMDGYEASRRIRRNGRWPDLPIVALTANALSDERERCRAAGMSDYLAKPFRREELAALLDTWLPATQATR